MFLGVRFVYVKKRTLKRIFWRKKNIGLPEHTLNVRFWKKNEFNKWSVICKYKAFQWMVKRMLLIPSIKRTFLKTHV